MTVIKLLILVISIPSMPTEQVKHEWHSFTFIEQRYVSDTPHSTLGPSDCGIAANVYIEGLQHAGVLPGAREVISYKVECSTTL